MSLRSFRDVDHRNEFRTGAHKLYAGVLPRLKAAHDRLAMEESINHMVTAGSLPPGCEAYQSFAGGSFGSACRSDC